MTADQIVAAAGGITLTSSNSTVIASNQLAIATTGDNKGKIVNTAQFGATPGTTTITATVNATGKSFSFTLTTGAARKLASLSIPTTLSGNLIQGAATNYALGYKDQYGKVFDAAADVAGYKVNVAVTKVSGDDGGLTIEGAGLPAGAGGDVADESAADAANAFTLKAVAGKTGSYTVTVKYINTATSEVVSQESKTINVVANSSAGITYSVDDIVTLYKDGADFNTVDVLETEDVDAGYAKEIKISAKDANGNTYVIPSSAIVSVSVDNTNAVVDEVGGKWYVAGNLAASPTADASSVLTVVINTNEGIQTITKTVNVSKAALVAQEVKLLDAEITDEDAAAVTSLTFADQTELLAGKTVHAYLIDQFGGHSMTFTGSEYVTNNNGFTFGAGDTFQIDTVGNVLELVDADSSTTATAGATARYVFVSANSKTAAIDVKVTGVVPTPAP